MPQVRNLNQSCKIESKKRANLPSLFKYEATVAFGLLANALIPFFLQ